MKIVTGYVGEKHITSNDDQGLLQGIFGTGCYILPVRGRLAATLISSNELQIADGEGILQGVHFRVEPGTTDSVTIENGSQGMQRIDLICARYEKNTESGVESMSWINHKGTEAASNPEQPSYTAGDLLSGDTLAEFPVYAVRLNGLTVQSVTQLATILSPQALIGNNSISGIGDGTITGALSALNASLSNNLNNLYTRDVLRGRTYTQSKQQDTALLFVGKSGANAVVAVIGRNGGTPFCTFLSGNSTFLSVSDSNGLLSFTTGTYTDGRIYSTYRTDETYS